MLDGYPGFVALSDLSEWLFTPTHRVAEARTIAYAEPDFKSPHRRLLGMNSLVKALKSEGEYVFIDGVGWVFADELSRTDSPATDFVDEAYKLRTTSYLWGGRNGALGIDCSAMVQHALWATGKYDTPRDSGPLAACVGVPIEIGRNADRRRGDLFFWSSHVGVMLNEVELLHSTICRRRIVTEPVDFVLSYRKEFGSELKSVKRIPDYNF